MTQTHAYAQGCACAHTHTHTQTKLLPFFGVKASIVSPLLSFIWLPSSFEVVGTQEDKEGIASRNFCSWVSGVFAEVTNYGGRVKSKSTIS